MLHARPEELGEDDAHDQQRQQGTEHAPQHAENRALVLLLEVARDELTEQETVLAQRLNRRVLPHGTPLHLP